MFVAVSEKWLCACVCVGVGRKRPMRGEATGKESDWDIGN